MLKYTSLREQHVYKRAAKLYCAAFSLDPSASGRALAAWLGRATPMEMDADSSGQPRDSQPPKRAKKSHGMEAVRKRRRWREGTGVGRG